MIEAIVEGLDLCPKLGGEEVTSNWFLDETQRKRLRFDNEAVREGVFTA